VLLRNIIVKLRLDSSSPLPPPEELSPQWYPNYPNRKFISIALYLQLLILIVLGPLALPPSLPTVFSNYEMTMIPGGYADALHPSQTPTSPDGPTIKKMRKRADAAQLRVLQEIYARTAFPSAEERHALSRILDMSARSVQIWFVSCLHSFTCYFDPVL
jgi:hypothetical protein